MNVEWEKLNELNRPYFKQLQKDLKQIEENGNYILGSNVQKFETNMSKYLGVKYCVAVGNGLDALTLSLMSLNLPENSEVIVPSNTFYASVLSILRAGLKPILCEPDMNTFNIDPNNIERLITKNTKAIMVVHLYGNPCDMKSICKLAKKYRLRIIEDCAQGFGASILGKKVGSFGTVAAFSFYPTKNLGGIGDAGLIATNSYKLYNFCKKSRTYGGENYKYTVKGINSRMDEIHAIFLNRKLNDIDKINDRKIDNANLYLNGIKNPIIKLPEVDKKCKHVFHIFCIRTNKRDELKKYLEDNGVRTLIHYPIPLYKQKVLHEHIEKTYMVSNKLSKTILSLPCSAAHTKEEIQYVIKLINDFR